MVRRVPAAIRRRQHLKFAGSAVGRIGTAGKEKGALRGGRNQGEKG
jgi:hypothetical protein